MKEGIDYVICNECGDRFRKLGIHLARTHNMSEDEYLTLHSGCQIVASAEVEKITNRLKSKKRGAYKKKVAYLLPDGTIVRRKTAWESAWNGSPPLDSILDASKVDLDPWKDKVEGVDYVVCIICGYRGKNLSRHVRKEHDIDKYDGILKSDVCLKSLSDAANKSWETKRKDSNKNTSME